MFYPNADDPYEQRSLPYQPYREEIDSWLYQSQKLVPSSAGSARSSQAKPSQQRLSKAEALAFVDQCKRWLIAGSLIAFGILGGLVAGHLAGANSNQATPGPNSPTTSPSSGGGFFQQQQGGGGYGFGNGNNWQPPVSSSRTS